MSREAFQKIALPIADERYQDRILPYVSRTFALTIPELPAPLRTPVTSAYLLCRIADTIEDEPTLSPESTQQLMQRFVDVVFGKEDADALARDLSPQLSRQTLPAERDLVLNMGRVVNVIAGFNDQQRFAIQRCVDVMCSGMHQFQRTASLRGLSRSSELDDYCYFVAGVVGQMLTELFCDYSVNIKARYGALHEVAVSFAQGLQMTNILKDVWEDRSRGACWLPQEVFTRYGIDLAKLVPGRADGKFDAAMRELVGVAHAHLRNALAYTLLIPVEEVGIRRFCLWAIGLAILTLGKIANTPGFTSGSQVKVSRTAVAMTRILTNISVRNDWMLKFLFEQAANGVPMAPPSAVPHPVRPTLHLNDAEYIPVVPMERGR